MNGSDHIPGGLELDEAVEIATLLETAGADSISISGGIHASRPYMIVPGMSVPRGCYVPYGEALKARLGIPVMTVGRINTPELAEEILAKGQADFICLSRALLADPFFPAKAAATVEAYRPVNRLQRCWPRSTGTRDRLHREPMVSRSWSSSTSRREALPGGWPWSAAASPERPVAVTAQAAANESTCSRGTAPSGQLLLAICPAPVAENAYFEREVKRLGVTVHLNRFHPGGRPGPNDAIILATGRNLKSTCRAWACPRDHGCGSSPGRGDGRNCVIIGGGLVGMEVVTTWPTVGAGDRDRRSAPKKAVHADRSTSDRIRDLGIEVLTHAGARDRPDTASRAPNGWRRVLKDVDSVISHRLRPRTEHEALTALGVRSAGGMSSPRKFFEAIEEGTLAAITL